MTGTRFNVRYSLYQITNFIEFSGSQQEEAEEAFDAAMELFLGPGFDYMQYVSTGGGKCTADNILQTLEERGTDLELVDAKLESVLNLVKRKEVEALGLEWPDNKPILCPECKRELRFNSGNPAVYHTKDCSKGPITYLGQGQLKIPVVKKDE